MAAAAAAAAAGEEEAGGGLEGAGLEGAGNIRRTLVVGDRTTPVAMSLSSSSIDRHSPEDRVPDLDLARNQAGQRVSRLGKEIQSQMPPRVVAGP